MKKHVTKSRDRLINYGHIPDNKSYSQSSGGISYNRAQSMAIYISDYYLLGAKSASTPIIIGTKTGHDVISYVNGGHDSFNPCNHNYGQSVLLPFACLHKAYNTSSYYFEWFQRRAAAYTQQPVVRYHAGVQDLLKAQIRAWLTLQPRFESEFSLLNFLFELHELKGLAKAAYKLLLALNLSARNISRRIGPITGEPTGNIANLILTWNLGITPLIMDLKSIWGLLQDKISKVLSDFQADGADLSTRHYSEYLSDVDERVSGAKNSYMFLTGKRRYTQFYATLDYTYEYKRTPTLGVLADYWGLTGDPEKIWNAIPFTFVLDYFVKIGKAIHFMKRDKSLNLTVFNYGESLKTKDQSGLYLSCNKPNVYTVINGAVDASGLVTGWESVLYNRYPTSPKKFGMYVPKAHNPTDKQRLNLLALVRASL